MQTFYFNSLFKKFDVLTDNNINVTKLTKFLRPFVKPFLSTAWEN